MSEKKDETESTYTEVSWDEETVKDCDGTSSYIEETVIDKDENDTSWGGMRSSSSNIQSPDEEHSNDPHQNKEETGRNDSGLDLVVSNPSNEMREMSSMTLPEFASDGRERPSAKSQEESDSDTPQKRFTTTVRKWFNTSLRSFNTNLRSVDEDESVIEETLREEDEHDISPEEEHLNNPHQTEEEMERNDPGFDLVVPNRWREMSSMSLPDFFLPEREGSFAKPQGRNSIQKWVATILRSVDGDDSLIDETIADEDEQGISREATRRSSSIIQSSDEEHSKIPHRKEEEMERIDSGHGSVVSNSWRRMSSISLLDFPSETEGTLAKPQGRKSLRTWFTTMAASRTRGSAVDMCGLVTGNREAEDALAENARSVITEEDSLEAEILRETDLPQQRKQVLRSVDEDKSLIDETVADEDESVISHAKGSSSTIQSPAEEASGVHRNKEGMERNDSGHDLILSNPWRGMSSMSLPDFTSETEGTLAKPQARNAGSLQERVTTMGVSTIRASVVDMCGLVTENREAEDALAENARSVITEEDSLEAEILREKELPQQRKPVLRRVDEDESEIEETVANGHGHVVSC